MEAVVILVVPLIALLIWAVAYFQAGSPDPTAERERQEQHIAWLEERLQHARLKNWDEQMVGNLNTQLEQALHRRRAIRQD